MSLPVQKRVHSNSNRHKADYYATSYETTEFLLQYVKFHKRIIEPACGEGHISRVLLNAGYDVQSFDLVDRGYGLGGIDFLTDPLYDKVKGQADIITNCPYSLCMEFVSRALDITHRKVALLLPIEYLSRMNWCKHLCLVLLFARHTDIAMNGDFEKFHGKNMKDYAWLIFDITYNGDPTLKVIKNIKVEKAYIAELRNKYLYKDKIDVNEAEMQRLAASATKDEIRQLILQLHTKGLSNRKIARLLNISEGKVRYVLNKRDEA